MPVRIKKGEARDVERMIYILCVKSNGKNKINGINKIKTKSHTSGLFRSKGISIVAVILFFSNRITEKSLLIGQKSFPSQSMFEASISCS